MGEKTSYKQLMNIKTKLQRLANIITCIFSLNFQYFVHIHLTTAFGRGEEEKENRNQVTVNAVYTYIISVYSKPHYGSHTLIACTHAHTHARTHTHTHAHTRTHTHTHARTHARAHLAQDEEVLRRSHFT